MPRGKITYVIYLDGTEHYEFNTQKEADEQFDQLVRIGNERFAPGMTVAMCRRLTSISHTVVKTEMLTGHNYETNPLPLPLNQPSIDIAHLLG